MAVQLTGNDRIDARFTNKKPAPKPAPKPKVNTAPYIPPVNGPKPNPAGITTTAPNNNTIFGSGSLVGQSGYGSMSTGNAASPWKDVSERNQANTDHVAPYGLDPNKSTTYQIGGDQSSQLFGSAYGADGTGGIFNPQGFSSNPYFLQGEIGVSRDQLKGTGLDGLSDIALKMAYTYDGTRDNLYVTPDGQITSFKSPGAVSVSDVRKVLAPLTGQTAYHKGDMLGGLLAPLAKPNYYDPSNPVQNNLAQQQQALINKMMQDLYATPTATLPITAPTAPIAPPVTPTIDPQTLYDLLLRDAVPVNDKKKRKYYNENGELIGGQA